LKRDSYLDFSVFNSTVLINASKAERKMAEIIWREKQHGESGTFRRHKKRSKIPILFPICPDWSVMNTDLVWVDDINKTRNIFDFSKWQDSDGCRAI
jgi:hypothetical protein